MEHEADYRAGGVEEVRTAGFLGSRFAVSGELEGEFLLNMPGRFNVDNALAAAAAADMVGIPVQAIAQGLRNVSVKGRTQVLPTPGHYTLLIDYAHNAVSMENLLTTLREYQPRRLIVLFGAGGNRPKVRRYEMGEACGKLADLSVITADNSRFEDVNDIIADILVGMKKTQGQYVTIPDRREAMGWCLDHAQPGDIVVFAGKGHEDYQEINGVKLLTTFIKKRI